MPTNFIYFSQPLFPIGLKLEVITSFSSNSNTVPDAHVVLEAWSKIEFQKDDHITVVSESVWTQYRVL